MNIKRIISLILCLCSVLTVLSSCKSNSSGSSKETTSAPATSEDKDLPVESNIVTWVTYGFEKVRAEKDAPAENKRSTEFDIYMAKNEGEACQISFRSPERYTGLSFAMTEGPSDDVSVDIMRVYTQSIANSDYPDAIGPLGEAISLMKNTTRTLYIRFNTETDTEAGTYTFTFALKGKKGELYHVYKINVHVWDFAYPEAPTMASMIPIDKQSLAYVYGLSNDPNELPTTEEGKAQLDILYKQYYDYLMERNISAWYLPYDILDPRADAYMSDPRITSFGVPHGVDDYTLARYYEKIKSNDAWLKKAVLYPVDEPTSKEMLDEIASHVKRFNRICPDIRVATSYFRNVQYDENRDQIEFMSEVLDLMCAKLACFNDSFIYNQSQLDKYGSFKDRMENFQKEGKTIWTYVCWEPRYPYANLLVNEAGVNHRVLFWQQYDYGSTGFLYWSATWWRYVKDPWTSTSTWLEDGVYGDGILLYPGNKVGVEGPCSSLRFEAIVDGIEDYELLTLAASKLGEAELAKIIDEVTTSTINYIRDSKSFNNSRIKLGNAIAAAIANTNA